MGAHCQTPICDATTPAYHMLILFLLSVMSYLHVLELVEDPGSGVRYLAVVGSMGPGMTAEHEPGNANKES